MHHPLAPDALRPRTRCGALELGALCASLGHTVEEASPPVDRDHLLRTFAVLMSAAAAAAISDGEVRLGRRARTGQLELATALTRRVGAGLAAVDLIEARIAARRLRADLGRFFGEYDVVLSPTLACARPPRNDAPLATGTRWGVRAALSPTVLARAMAPVLPIMGFTALANVGHLPSATLPMGTDADGFPVGTMLTGAAGADRTVLQLAAELERARPWGHRRPPVHAARDCGPHAKRWLRRRPRAEVSPER